jgi:hypothetical protein
MASQSSEGWQLPRAPWQAVFVALPESQLGMFSKNIVWISLNSINKAAEILCDPSFNGVIDPESTEALEVLKIFSEVGTINGNLTPLRYFLKKKTLDKMIQALDSLCMKLISPRYNPLRDTPRQIVMKWLAVLIICWLEIAGIEMPQGDVTRSNLRVCYTMYGMCSMLDTYSFEIESKVKDFIKENIGSQCTPDGFMSFMQGNSRSLKCSEMSYSSASFSVDKYKELLMNNKNESEFILAQETVCTFLTNLARWRYDFKHLSDCNIAKVRNIVEDPVPEWEEASAMYLNFLKRAFKEAKEQSMIGDYHVAYIAQSLLHAMLSGISKTVTYQEIKEVTDDMEAAAGKCFAWAPPLWKLEMKTDVKIVREDVLPFIRSNTGEANRLLLMCLLLVFLSCILQTLCWSALERTVSKHVISAE